MIPIRFSDNPYPAKISVATEAARNGCGRNLIRKQLGRFIRRLKANLGARFSARHNLAEEFRWPSRSLPPSPGQL